MLNDLLYYQSIISIYYLLYYQSILLFLIDHVLKKLDLIATYANILNYNLIIYAKNLYHNLIN